MNKMKRKSIICMLLASMMFGMFSTSCQDMLSPDSERHAYTVAEDTLYSYWGILKSLQNIAERYVILNECRGDLVDASGFVSDTIAAIVNFGEVDNPDHWKDGACAYLNISDYYHVINSCNAYISMCDTMRTTGTNKKYMLSELCQVKAIRAWVYMQLLYAYGENRVPFYTDPMLTTDDINDFLENKKVMLTAERLVEELAPDLEQNEMLEYDSRYGLPQYNNYGDVSMSSSHFVCHSSKCMFPMSIVLGDLYLLAAQKADDEGMFRKAANFYYNYLNSQNGGPLDVVGYLCYGVINDRLDYPNYYYLSGTYGNPYRDPYPVSRYSEAITCIPSNTGKLEGKVMTDVCRLFGFEAEMSTVLDVNATNDDDESGTNSHVYLTPQYERELIPSRGYEALCDSQKFEVYIGTVGNDGFEWTQPYEIVELKSERMTVGDARRYWIYRYGGSQYSFAVGENTLYGKMVSKQNPGGGFTTTYPVIYRKSTVWLRYAEALNRAGFPSYAFAVLKNGLCNNSYNWYPVDPNKSVMESDGQYLPASNITFEYFTQSGTVNKEERFDYPIKATDSLFCYIDEVSGTVIPEDWRDENRMSTYAELEAYLTDFFNQEMEDYNAANPDEPMEEPRTINKDNVVFSILTDDSFENQASIFCEKACYYLDRREVIRAADAPFLNYKQPYLRGDLDQIVLTKDRSALFTPAIRFENIGSMSDDATFTIGVHQRGCGLIRYDDPVDELGNRSSYNYVKMVQKKIKENTGKEIEDADIYSGQYDEEVKDAVEDLIIDEMALELAFEGTRFSDLCRVAQHRGADYLASRVAKRHTGEVDETLRSRLQNKANWFLPIPEK